jgi:hypothetical protein
VTRFGEFSPVGRLFYSGLFTENYRPSPNVCAAFLRVKRKEFSLTKKGLGYISGDFLTNSFGHPVLKQLLEFKLFLGSKIIIEGLHK